MTDDWIARVKQDPSHEGHWGSWFRAMYPKLFAVAYRLQRGDADAAGDVVQETFYRFIQYGGLAKVADDDKAAAYLFTTCRNIIRTRMMHDRKRERLRDDHAVLEDLPGPEMLSDGAIDLDSLGQDLNVEDRQILDWSRRGMRLGDIAARLGISYTAAGVRMHRIIGRLRASLKAK